MIRKITLNHFESLCEDIKHIEIPDKDKLEMCIIFYKRIGSRQLVHLVFPILIFLIFALVFNYFWALIICLSLELLAKTTRLFVSTAILGCLEKVFKEEKGE